MKKTIFAVVSLFFLISLGISVFAHETKTMETTVNGYKMRLDVVVEDEPGQEGHQHAADEDLCLAAIKKDGKDVSDANISFTVKGPDGKKKSKTAVIHKHRYETAYEGAFNLSQKGAYEITVTINHQGKTTRATFDYKK